MLADLSYLPKEVIFLLLCISSRLLKKRGEEQVDAFLEKPLAKSLPTKDSFPSKAFQQFYLNTILTFHPLPLLSACVQWAKMCWNPNVLVIVTCTLKSNFSQKIGNFNIKNFARNGLQYFFASNAIICCVKYITQESITCYLFIVLIGPIWAVIFNGSIFREI